jgi:hypothetical protein
MPLKQVISGMVNLKCFHRYEKKEETTQLLALPLFAFAHIVSRSLSGG